jgi:hypothetical protein
MEAMAVALLALVISLISAVYARRSADEAKRANDLSLHEMQVKVLNAVLEFQQALPSSPDSINSLVLDSLKSSLEAFMKDAVIPSKLYLSSNHSSVLNKTNANLASAAKTIEDGYYGDVNGAAYENAKALIMSEVANVKSIIESISSELRICRA